MISCEVKVGEQQTKKGFEDLRGFLGLSGQAEALCERLG